MTITPSLLLLAILLLATLCCIILIIRNELVYKYRVSLNIRGYTICNEHLNSISSEEYTKEKHEYHQYLRSMWDSICDISYDEMLIKFWKPLKDEYWLTKEQRKFLDLKFN